MKIAITRIFLPATMEKETAAGLEAMWLKKHAEMNGHEAFFLGNSNRNESFLSSSTDLQDFDEIWLQDSHANFFAGEVENHTKEMAKKLPDFKGRIVFWLNDPALAPSFSQIERLDKYFPLSEELKTAWKRIYEESEYFSPVEKIEKWLHLTPKRWKHFNWFREIFLDQKIKSIDSFRKWDLCYYGSNRGGYREKLMKKYFQPRSSNLLIGPSVELGVTQLKKLPHAQTMDFLRQCKLSLIIGDQAHEDCSKTFRFYEAAVAGCLPAISTEFDPHRKLIQNERLRELVYVSSSEEIHELLANWSVELCELYREEVLGKVKIHNLALF